MILMEILDDTLDNSEEIRLLSVINEVCSKNGEKQLIKKRSKTRSHLPPYKKKFSIKKELTW